MNHFVQLGLGQLLSVHTVVHHGHMVQIQVVADSQLPAEVGDVLERLLSKLLLAKRVVYDFFCLFTINPDPNFFAIFVKNELEVDILGVSISDAKARFPTKKCEIHVRSPMARIATNSTCRLPYESVWPL